MKSSLWLIFFFTSMLCAHASNEKGRKTFNNIATGTPLNLKTSTSGNASRLLPRRKHSAEGPKNFSKQFQEVSFFLKKMPPEKVQNQLEQPDNQAKKFSGTEEALYELRKGQHLLYKKAAYQQAEAAFLRAEVLLRSLNKTKELFSLYHHLAQLYARTGQGVKHREVLGKQTTALQRNFQTQMANEFKALNKAYNFENQTLQLASLKTGIKRQKNLFSLASILLMLAAVTCLALGVHYQKYRRKEKLLLAHNEELVKVEGTPVPLQVKKDASGHPEDISRYFFQSLFLQTEKFIHSKKRHLDPSLQLADVAFELGVNEKYVSQAIATGSGKNYREYLANLRIQEARNLLSESPALTIKEVAWQSGFGNQPQFQRKFKEVTGLTPQTWKKMMHS